MFSRVYLFLSKDYMNNLNQESKHVAASKQIQAIRKINIVQERVVF